MDYIDITLYNRYIALKGALELRLTHVNTCIRVSRKMRCSKAYLEYLKQKRKFVFDSLNKTRVALKTEKLNIAEYTSLRADYISFTYDEIDINTQ